MSTLDIIIISAGALAVGVYAFISIRKTLKYNKVVKHLMQDEHLTKQQAIALANKEFKYKQKGKKKKSPEQEDKVFEE